MQVDTKRFLLSLALQAQLLCTANNVIIGVLLCHQDKIMNQITVIKGNSTRKSQRVIG